MTKKKKGETMKTQIAVMKTDMEYMKKKLDDFIIETKPKIIEMHDTYLTGEGKIKGLRENINEIKKDLNGNGKKGLKAEVNDLKYWIAGASAVIGAAVVIATVIF